MIETHTTSSVTMQASVRDSYGEPATVLSIASVARPVPHAEQVLVRVHAAAVTIGDHHLVTGKPYLIRLTPFGGFPRPRHATGGLGFAGVVEAVGAAVTGFHVGDVVFGESQAFGAWAQYVAVGTQVLAHKPASLSFEHAAALPWAATALQGLRDVGQVGAGKRVLILGASGGVGSWAVQLAKVLGAEVTAVCSTRNLDYVRGLGADHVVDHTHEDVTQRSEQWDVIFDLVGIHALAAVQARLVEGGIYVGCAGGGGEVFGPFPRMIGLLLRSIGSRRAMKPFMTKPNAADLQVLAGLADAGRIRAQIHRSVTLDQLPRALHEVGQGGVRGQIVVAL
jgi:NADPH:quinone reductase-like Zn-dependent oxidoreductase